MIIALKGVTTSYQQRTQDLYHQVNSWLSTLTNGMIRDGSRPILGNHP